MTEKRNICSNICSCVPSESSRADATRRNASRRCVDAAIAAMTAARRLTARLVLLLSLLHLARAPYELTLRSNFGGANSFQTDNRGDEDNISPPISWTGVPKNTESYVLIFESTKKSKNNDAGDDNAPKAKTHWLLYDIPKEVTELREELSGNGASDVSRLGMKDDAGQAPVVVDPMGQIDGWVDPEIEAMQKMIHGALDASFDVPPRGLQTSAWPLSRQPEAA